MRDILTRRGLVAAAPAAILATAIPQVVGTTDRIFAQIELHKALRHRVNTMPEGDDDPLYQAVCDAEEAAIQELGDMRPTSVAAAARQLAYMAEIEGDFAKNGSPLLQTVLSVAQGLASLQGGAGA